MTVLATPRLRLEPVADAHFDELLAMNSMPEVMRYITGKPDSPEDTQAMIERVKARWAEDGFSWWSMFELASGRLIGACGVMYLGRDPANPLELGWRLRPEAWGQGFASEAAARIAQFAFDDLDAPLVCAICHPDNLASSRVMERLGMHYRGEELWYDRNVAVYQMTRAQWLAAR
jgi:RimJ/RimL family protein N-acetyltransferase